VPVRGKVLTTVPTFSKVHILLVPIPTFTGVFLPENSKWPPETGSDFSFAFAAHVWMTLVSIFM